MDSSGNRLDLGESKVKGLRYYVPLEWKTAAFQLREKIKLSSKHLCEKNERTFFFKNT